MSSAIRFHVLRGWISRRRMAVLAVVAWSLLASSAALAAPPTSVKCAKDPHSSLNVNLQGEEMRVSGATRNSRVLIVGYSRIWDPERFSTRFERHRAYRIADAEGVVRQPVDPAELSDSVWVALDIQSGDCIAFDDLTQGRQKELGSEAVKREKGKVSKLELPLSLAYLVVVRPGTGAWEATVGDGGLSDTDHQVDGKSHLSLDGLKAIGSSGTPPAEFEKNDVLIVFSPQLLSVSFARLDK